MGLKNAKLGIMSACLQAQGMEEAFSRAKQAGADGLEVCYSNENEALSLGKADHVRQLTDLASSTGVAISSLALTVLCRERTLLGDDKHTDAALDIIERALDTAASVGAPVLLVPFFGKNVIDLEDDLRKACNALSEVVDTAEQAGVIIGVESTINFNQQHYMIENLGATGWVRSYLDTGNALARKLDLPTGIRDLAGEAIAGIHFKDVHIKEGHPADANIKLGEGDVDFDACVLAMEAIGYDGWVVLETASLDDPVATAKTNLDFARNALAN